MSTMSFSKEFIQHVFKVQKTILNKQNVSKKTKEKPYNGYKTLNNNSSFNFKGFNPDDVDCSSANYRVFRLLWSL